MRTIIAFFILLSVHFCFGSGYQNENKTSVQKLTPYTIQPKDTWFNLSKKFNTTIQELQSVNAGVTDLKIGQKINVPTTVKLNAAPQKEKSTIVTPIDKNAKNPVYYTVKPHETLYHISKENKVTVDDIKKWNGLSSNNVSVDQRLIVAYGSTVTKEKPAEATAVPVKKEDPLKEVAPTENSAPKKVDVIEVPAPVVKKDKEVKEDSTLNKEAAVTSGANKITETGVVSWFGDGDLNQNKFYALHRTVPIGTIIKVTNRMNNNSVFVKVVGALPTTGDNENIILKITQAAAQRIGALDQKFQAELSYAIAQ